MKQSLMDHLNHVTYPIKGDQLKMECDNWSDVEGEKEEMMGKIMDDKEYQNAGEVMMDLGMNQDMNAGGGTTPAM